MADYDLFSKHYDAVMGQPKTVVPKLISYIEKYNPDASSILEVACGTGAILKLLPKKYELHGLDRSQGMLTRAKKKVKRGHFYRANMESFSLKQKFDVVLCVFDSLNHLLKISDWRKCFIHVSRVLNENGIFVFDINTPRKLKQMSTSPAYVAQFGKNLMIMTVREKRALFNWNVRVFEYKKGKSFSLYEEDIREASFPLADVRNYLSEIFSYVKVEDEFGCRPKAKSRRLYFVCCK